MIFPRARGYDKSMKLLLLILTIFLFACGPSQEEKENIATISCNIMGESRNMDAAFRIREINDAREKIGGAPFLNSDKEIKESFEYNLCKELVLGDSNYQQLLDKAKEEAKQAQAAYAKKLLEIDKENRAKEKEKEKEKEKKKNTTATIDTEIKIVPEKTISPNQARLNQIVKEHIENSPKPHIKNLNLWADAGISLTLSCANLKGFGHEINMELLNGETISFNTKCYEELRIFWEGLHRPKFQRYKTSSSSVRDTLERVREEVKTELDKLKIDDMCDVYRTESGGWISDPALKSEMEACRREMWKKESEFLANRIFKRISMRLNGILDLKIMPLLDENFKEVRWALSNLDVSNFTNPESYSFILYEHPDHK